MRDFHRKILISQHFQLELKHHIRSSSFRSLCEGLSKNKSCLEFTIENKKHNTLVVILWLCQCQSDNIAPVKS